MGNKMNSESLNSIRKKMMIAGTTFFLGSTFFFSNTLVHAESIDKDNNTVTSGVSFYEKPHKKQYSLKQDVALDSGLNFNNSVQGILPKGMGTNETSYLGNVYSNISGSLLFGSK